MWNLNSIFRLSVLTLLITFLNESPSWAYSPGFLHVVEITPTEATDYTVDQELKQLKTAAMMAANDYQEIEPKCSFKLKFDLRQGSEEELYSVVQTISRQHERSVLVGLTRTDFARLAAKAAEKSSLMAVSAGAATASLSKINPNFVSIVSPWQKQWDAIKLELAHNNCDPNSTLAIFDDRNVLSSNFQSAFSKQHQGKMYDMSQLSPAALRDLAPLLQCFFIGMNFSDAKDYLITLLNSHWHGLIVGVGDWNFFSTELKTILQENNEAQIKVAVPTGWTAEVTKRSQAFNQRMLKVSGHQASPLGAYTYDASLLALDYLCTNSDFRQFNPVSLKRLPLTRHYNGISETGNYLSEMIMIRAQ